MGKSKNDLNIDFKGKTDGLVIRLNGKVIFPYKEEAVEKEIHPNKLKTQLKTGVAAVFCGAVNRIDPLQQTWKKWPVKSRIPYRNILAANIKRCGTEHPTKANIICPPSTMYLPDLKAIIDAKGINIEIWPLANKVELTEDETLITAAGVLSVHNPREKGYEPCTIYPLISEIKDLLITEKINVRFGFNEEMKDKVVNYENAIIYFTIVIGKSSGLTTRWFWSLAQEFLLSNDGEGKFKGGEKIMPSK